jgi:putative acetyltransferase
VAQDAENNNALPGFIGYENNGHLDLMFTSPTAARRGIASRLLGLAEAALGIFDVQTLFTEASLLGRPLFERRDSR